MTKPEILSDEQIVAFLEAGASETERRRAMYQLYTNRDLKAMVYSQVLRHGGSEENAGEVFREVLILFERAVREGRFKGESRLRTYVVGIAKWHWHNVLRKKNNTLELKPELYDGEVAGVDIRVISAEQRAILTEALEQLGERCQELLHYWALSYSPEELCRLFDFSSTDMAKKATYRCRERLKAFFDANPHLRDELYD